MGFALVSCTDDAYYSLGGTYSNGYGGGYGSGYGYGSSNFSTSYFVATGDPRWGYDPYCYSYYDYTRHCYYDPYLYGYYPRGYRPQVVVGVPHPYGYRNTYCPPPRRIVSDTLANYNNRESAYRNSNYSWARQVRQQPQTQSRGNYGGRPQSQTRQEGYPQQNSRSYQPPATSTRGSSSSTWGNRQQAPGGGTYPPRGGASQPQPSTSDRQSGLPPSYNVPIRTTPYSPPAQTRPDRPDRRSRPEPSMQSPQMQPNLPQPTRSQRESSRPVAQPPIERSAPPAQPAPAAREAPGSPSPAGAREVRGLGEGRDRSR